MQPVLKKIYVIAALLVVGLAGAPVMARADVAAENAHMQEHISKIIPAYHAAKAGDVMEPWVETETLRQLARGYAFLGDEARMQETLAQVPIIKQRGTLLYPYMDLMLARLQAEDIAGVFDLFKNMENAVSTVNKPARDWEGKDPAPINDTTIPWSFLRGTCKGRWKTRWQKNWRWMTLKNATARQRRNIGRRLGAWTCWIVWLQK